MRTRGRPSTSKLPRAEQLRRAKRKQRAAQRRDGLVSVQLTLPQVTAQKLALVRRSGDLVRFLDEALERATVRIADYPGLADLAWNRTDELISVGEAFALYERNWRHLSLEKLAPQERQLIDRLARQFGGGLINA